MCSSASVRERCVLGAETDMPEAIGARGLAESGSPLVILDPMPAFTNRRHLQGSGGCGGCSDPAQRLDGGTSALDLRRDAPE